jgi:hypothetical protein
METANQTEKTCPGVMPRQVLVGWKFGKLEGEMKPKLHTSPEVDNACNLARVSDVNKCRAVAGGLCQIHAVERVEHVPLEIQVSPFRDNE